MADLKTDDMAADAQNFINDPIFGVVIDKLRAVYLAELMAAPVGTLTATTAHAKLLVLEDIPLQLGVIINAAKYKGRNR